MTKGSFHKMVVVIRIGDRDSGSGTLISLLIGITKIVEVLSLMSTTIFDN